MATLYEYYNTNDDGAYSVYGGQWKAQTFTPAIAHTITSVKLKLSKVGLPGTITVSIRATTGGHPSDGDLCSGTYDGDTLGAYPGGWVEITLGAGAALSASTMYAIVVRAPGGDASNYVLWGTDASSPTYDGGAYEASGDSGVNWTTNSGIDFMFEEYGPAVAVGRSYGYIIG